jgi:hypothetical protein
LGDGRLAVAAVGVADALTIAWDAFEPHLGLPIPPGLPDLVEHSRRTELANAHKGGLVTGGLL